MRDDTLIFQTQQEVDQYLSQMARLQKYGAEEEEALAAFDEP